MCPQADVRQNRGGALRRGWPSEAIQYLSHVWAKRLKYLLPWQEVIGEEVRHLMGNGEALFFGPIGGTDKDEPMATMSDETAAQLVLVVRHWDDDAPLLQPIAGCRYVGLCLFDNDQR